MISKDWSSHVTFMETSLSAGGGAQGPLAFPNAIEAACGSQNNKNHVTDEGVQGQGSHLGGVGPELQDMIFVMGEAQGRDAQAISPLCLRCTLQASGCICCWAADGQLQWALRASQSTEVAKIRLIPPLVCTPRGRGPRPQWP